MAEKVNKTGIFQWNAGGWFGAQIGATLWILILGSLVAPTNMNVAAMVFGLFWVPNIVGAGFWMWRDKIDVYPALQSLMALIGVCAFAAVHLIEQAGLWNLVSGVPLNDNGLGTVSAGAMKLVIIIGAPGLMLLFHLRKRQGNPDATKN